MSDLKEKNQHSQQSDNAEEEEATFEEVDKLQDLGVNAVSLLDLWLEAKSHQCERE